MSDLLIFDTVNQIHKMIGRYILDHDQHFLHYNVLAEIRPSHQNLVSTVNCNDNIRLLRMLESSYFVSLSRVVSLIVDTVFCLFRVCRFVSPSLQFSHLRSPTPQWAVQLTIILAGNCTPNISSLQKSCNHNYNTQRHKALKSTFSV